MWEQELLRIKHLRNVIFRNIEQNDKPYLTETSISFHLPLKKKRFHNVGSLTKVQKPFFSSQVHVPSLNPSWSLNPEDFDCIPIGESQKKVYLKVWNGQKEVLFDFFIDLISLVRLKGKSISNHPVLPSNCLLLVFTHERIFALPDAQFEPSSVYVPTPIPTPQKEITIKEILANATSYLSLLRQKKILSQKLGGLSQKLNYQIHQKNQIISRHNKVLTRLYNLDHYEANTKTEFEETSKIAERIKNRKTALLFRAESLLERYNLLIFDVEQINSASQEAFQQSFQDMGMVSKLYNLRASILIAKLSSFYPIVIIDSQDVYRIRGLLLPSSPSIAPSSMEEEIDTAIGHVCHFVVLAAKFLCITLRYRISTMGCRSSINDDVSSRSFSLFSKDVDRRVFERGLKLLDDDINQILAHQNIIAFESQHILEKIRSIYNHFVPSYEQT